MSHKYKGSIDREWIVPAGKGQQADASSNCSSYPNFGTPRLKREVECIHIELGLPSRLRLRGAHHPGTHGNIGHLTSGSKKRTICLVLV